MLVLPTWKFEKKPAQQYQNCDKTIEFWIIIWIQ